MVAKKRKRCSSSADDDDGGKAANKVANNNTRKRCSADECTNFVIKEEFVEGTERRGQRRSAAGKDAQR